MASISSRLPFSDWRMQRPVAKPRDDNLWHNSADWIPGWVWPNESEMTGLITPPHWICNCSRRPALPAKPTAPHLNETMFQKSKINIISIGRIPLRLSSWFWRRCNTFNDVLALGAKTGTRCKQLKSNVRLCRVRRVVRDWMELSVNWLKLN